MTDVQFTYIHPADGTLRIVAGAPMEQLASVKTFGSVDEYKQFIRDRSIPPGAIDVREMPEGWRSPADRSFRNAWKRRGVDKNFSPDFDIDMPKARDIQKQKVRRQWMRAERDGGLDDDMNGIPEAAKAAKTSTRRNALRNLVNRIDAATSPDELKALTLEVL